MTFLTLVGLLVLTYAAAGQQQNYLDYDYQEPAPVRQPSPPQRSFSRPSPSQGFSRSEINKPTPVPILKQINRHNDDGSYTYGYEGADGSFKIETKLPTGEVTGKYGYVDDTGKLRVVDYGANKYGFQPVGEGITVAPPTLVDESTRKDPKTGETFVEYDDGSYFEPEPPRPAPRPAPRPPKRVKPSPPARLPVHTPRTFVSYEESQQDQGFGPSSPAFGPSQSGFGPSQSSFAPRPSPPRQGSPSPVPPRAAIPGAAPVGPVYKPQTFSAPVPVKPVREPIRDHYQPRSAPSSSYLDQLAQQYALPQGSGQPLHDISFGSYTSQTHY